MRASDRLRPFVSGSVVPNAGRAGAAAFPVAFPDAFPVAFRRPGAAAAVAGRAGFGRRAAGAGALQGSAR